MIVVNIQMKMKTLLDKDLIIKDPNYQKKILLIDLETCPSIGAYFSLWDEGNILWNEKYWYILCFAYKWLGEKEVYSVALPDFKGYKKDKESDEELVKKLWELFDQADIIIAQNGNAFDIKKSNARFIKWRLEPPSFYQTIDTLRIARKYFKFDSNKLDDLGDYLGIGRKLRTEKGLWRDCMKGDKHAWKMMRDYNGRDVILLEKVYYKLRAWDTFSPNLNLLYGGYYNCPTCGSNNTEKRGFRYTKTNTYQQFKCNNCGRWATGENIKSKKDVILR
jgi:hypothetical protein